jgi:hypothetical protein
MKICQQTFNNSLHWKIWTKSPFSMIKLSLVNRHLGKRTYHRATKYYEIFGFYDKMVNFTLVILKRKALWRVSRSPGMCQQRSKCYETPTFMPFIIRITLIDSRMQMLCWKIMIQTKKYLKSSKSSDWSHIIRPIWAEFYILNLQRLCSYPMLLACRIILPSIPNAL